MRTFLKLLFCFISVNALAGEQSPGFEWRDGDRVAFVGGVFMERELEGGHLETALALSAPGKSLSFRNFGWGGDAVESHLAPKVPARPSYVPSLFVYLEKYQPSVVFISYGMMESFRGESGLPEFRENYAKLLDKVSAISRSRIVLVSPFRHEKLGGHYPDPTEHNRLLQQYVDATKQLAKERNLPFVDLFANLPIAKSKKQLTSNGVHLNDAGYRAAATVITSELGLRTTKLKNADAQNLRAAIQHKNRQWWFHYRPMNSEYVYPGGTRYQNDLGGIKHPMYSEIEAFAELAAKEERSIQEFCRKLGTGTRSAKITVARATLAPPSPDPAPDPAIERGTFQVAEGMEVNLFAADPDISKPVQMAFDKKGRLWIATTTHYPQIKPGEDPSDKIIILEDIDGDGRADKKTVFADGLVIPTGVLPYRDGAFVFDDTTLLLLRDTDGDGRADLREVVLSGFGTEDSHHKGHTLRWGPEGRLHFNVGVFLHNNIETPYGTVSMSGYWQPGIFAYDPEAGRLDIYLANSVPPNPWGHYWNRWGNDFFIDSSGQQGSNLILPTSGRTSSALPVAGGEGKLAGGELISGRHFPENWSGHLVSAPFKENRVARWEFSDDGSGYAMKPLPSLIVTKDTSFRPVDERMGPDGALYISDWYNPLIGHMQHHFRDPGRDFTHGRIWRITAKGRSLVSRPKIAGASIKQLLEQLKAPEDYTRHQARRELAERSSREVIPSLTRWTESLDSTDPHFDHHRLEALWVYQSHRQVNASLLRSALQAKDPNARAAATSLLREWHGKIPGSIDLLSKLAGDPHPRVRLQAVIAASYLPDIRAVDAALRVLDFPLDRYLEQALKNMVVASKAVWETALAGDKPIFAGDPKRLSFLVKNAALEADPKVLLHLLKANQIAPENLHKTLAAIASNGTKTDLEKLYVQEFAPPLQAKVFEALARAARERQIVLYSEFRNRLSMYFEHEHQPLRAAALRLAGAWKLEAFRPHLEAAGKHQDAAVRNAAWQGLAYLGGERSKQFFAEAIPNAQGDERQALMSTFVELDVNAAAASAASLLSKPLPPTELAPLLNAFLQRKDGSELLAGALAQTTIDPDNAKLALRQLQKAARHDAALVAALSTAAGSKNTSEELTRHELEQMAADVLAKGDAGRGEIVFRRPELSCFQCHAIGGAGGLLGPDLSAVGSGSKLDYLIESLLQPNKIIKDGFETVEITTKDDEYILGIKVRENARETVLKDAARNEIVIPASTIKEKKHSPVSLMPAGLTEALTRNEFLDLCRFLGELGRPGPYANNPNPILRRWQVGFPAPGETATHPDKVSWSPLYTTVSGMIPTSEVSAPATNSIVWLRSQFEMTTAGQVQLIVNDVSGLRLQVNGTVTPLQTRTIIDLPKGTQTLLLELDLRLRREDIRAELEQVPGSPGRFQLLTGR